MLLELGSVSRQLEFLQELSELEKNSICVNSEDSIRSRLEALFHDKVGSPFSNQSELSELFKEGEIRYKHRIPPGFKDSSKEKKESDSFSYGGLLYERKYGDLIVWRQISEHAKTESLKDIIFVTDDSKSDWWWKMDSGGSQTIGARPELVEEIDREAGVERFHIYNTEGFLKFANQQLNAQVAEQAIEEVRAVTFDRKLRYRSARDFQRMALLSEQAVFDWLSDRESFDEIEIRRRGFPDIIAHRGDKKYGFEVKMIRDPRMLHHRLEETIYKSYYSLNEEEYFEFCIVLVLFDESMIRKAMEMISRRLPEFDANLRILVGCMEYDEDTDEASDFRPFDEVSLRKRM